MESNQLKTLNVDWLGHCPTCEREQHTVSTSEGNKDYLYEDDTVKCWCGQTGVIETDGEGHAWCNWDKKAATEWDNFNLYYRQKFPEYWDLLPKANHQACQHHEELFNSWVEAKSQAVPEGFVLVPRELSADEARKHAEAMFNKVERMARNEQRDLSESEFELFKNRWIDARTLIIQFDWKAMIEAQEQSHD